MASQQELNNQKQYNELLKEARELAANLQIGPEVEETMANLKTDITGAQRVVNDLRRDWNEFSSDVVGVSNTFKNIVDDLKQGSSAVGDTTKGFKNLADIGNKLLNSQRGYNKLSVDQIKDLQKKAQLEKDAIRDNLQRLELAKKEAQNNLERAKAAGDTSGVKRYQKELAKIVNAEEESLALVGDQQLAFKALTDQLGKEEDKVKKINEAMGLTGATANGISTLLNKAGFGNLASALKIDEVTEKVENELQESLKVVNEETGEITYKTATFNEKLGAATKLVTGMGANLVKNLTDPLAIGTFLVTQLVDAFMMVDKTSGDIAKSLGTSIGNARQISSRMNDIALDSDSAFVSTKNLTESFVTLNEQYGTAVNFSREQLENFTELTKQAGYSNEAALKLNDISVATGQSTKEVASNYLGSAKAAALQEGVLLSNKQISEAIKDVSNATLLTLQQNPEALGNAIGKAKALGMELSQVENIAGKLLDFESSISAELEAELLTGKQLNLETARLAALNGDIATVAEEIANQIGSAADFGKMNVIQQEALAKSVGMEREQLAKTLKDKEVMAKLSGVEGKTAQEKFNNLVKEVGMEEAKRRLGDDALASQMQQANMQEKMAANIEKLKEVFVGIAEALMPTVESIASMFKYLTPIVSLAGKLLKIIAPLAPLILTIVAAMKTYKFLTDDIYRRTILTNAAKKLGLITDKQATVQGKINNMLAKDYVKEETKKNLVKEKGVLATIKDNLYKRLGLKTDKETNLSLGKQVWFKMQKAYHAGKESVINTKNWLLEKKALVIDKARLMWAKLTNKENLKSYATTLKNFAMKVREQAIEKGTLALQYLINAARAIGGVIQGRNLLKSAANMLTGVGKYAISAANSVAKIPYVGPVLAIAAAAAAVAGGMALYNKFKKADDLMSPGQGMAGYGNRLLLAPEGQFALNNRDTVIAGTNLNRPETGINPAQSKPAPAPAAPARQSSPQQSEIKNNTSVTVKMDADKLGMASAKSSNRIQ